MVDDVLRGQDVQVQAANVNQKGTTSESIRDKPTLREKCESNEHTYPHSHYAVFVLMQA